MYEIRREAQSFYTGFFICTPTTRVASATKISASKRKSTVFVQCLVSTHDFFKISQNPLHASGAWRHSHCVTPFPISDIVTRLSDTSAPCARAWTPALMVHLSNLCTEPKGSQPNQTQRHKSKSLSHYITTLSQIWSSIIYKVLTLGN